MSVSYVNKLREALSDIFQEIDETRERLAYLEESAENIRKCLPQPLIRKNLSSPNTDAHTPPEVEKQPAKGKRKGYRKKNTHALKIHTIVSTPGKKWKINDVIEEYPKRGYTIPLGNAYNQIYRNVTDRKDLFIYEDGYILPKIQRQALHKEVET